jgi:small conductance mechanosensitive channel
VISTLLPPEAIKNLNELAPFLLEHGLSLVTAILILVAGNWLSVKAQHWTSAALRRTPHVDATLQGFFGSIARYFVLGFTLLAVLAEFGVQTASLIAVLGAAGLAVGLALQGTLSNVAAGVMLLIFRPFRAGHYVEVGGIAGTVVELTLFTTELKTADNVQIIVPNASVWGQAVKNYSHHATRRLELTFHASYDADLAMALGEIKKIVDAEPRILKAPAPLVTVAALGDVSVDILVRLWTASGDLENVKFYLTQTIKDCFDGAGIDIPLLPHMVHDGNEEAATAPRSTATRAHS